MLEDLRGAAAGNPLAGRARRITRLRSLGTDLDYLRELVAYWAGGVRLDRPGSRRSPASPLPASGSGACGSTSCTPGPPGPAGPVLPLVLDSTAGPDSFWRYTKVIGLLTDLAAHGADLADAFDVITVPDDPWLRVLRTARPARSWTPSPSPAIVGLAHATILGYPWF